MLKAPAAPPGAALGAALVRAQASLSDLALAFCEDLVRSGVFERLAAAKKKQAE
jgi:hypothetical protein